MEVTVLFYSIPLSYKVEELEQFLIDDQNLTYAANEYAKKLEEEDIEVWKIDKNILITEDGYKVGVYKDELLNVKEV